TLPGQDVAGRQPITDEDGGGHGNVGGEAARGGARRGDDVGSSWGVEDLTLVHGDEFGDVGRTGTSLSDRVPHELSCAADLHPSPRRLGFDLATGTGGVCLVHVHRNAVVATQPLGKPEVISIAVGEDDAADVVERSVHAGEFGVQITPLSGQASIDN